VESRTTRWPGNYGSSPTLVHGATELRYTWEADSAPEPLRRWSASSDPVLREARRILDTGATDRQALVNVDAEVRTEVDEALATALRSPEPDPARAAEFVLAPPL
jgi:TPP-dependent pyruvate/acetoin dehydrogenase alpha subunit